MFIAIRNKFKNNPSIYYSISIAATWAGAASLLVGIQTAQTEGIIPFLLWALGNTLACVVFGIFAPMIPKLREVFRSKPMQIILGLMCPFHVWISMNAIQQVFGDTWLGASYGTLLAYVIAVIYVVILFRRGMIRNVLTDNASWIAVYAVATILTVAAIIQTGGNMVPLEMGAGAAMSGLRKCLLLIPGPFLYPYFFEILDYNDKNEDGTQKINIRKAFVFGGLLFGAYLIFTFLLSWTRFSPSLNVIKAILITLVAVSTLSSMQFGMYLTFGRKVGLGMNIASIAAWQFLIPLGVMGVWSLMATVRIYIVVASIAVALIWHFVEKRKKGVASCK